MFRLAHRSNWSRVQRKRWQQVNAKTCPLFWTQMFPPFFKRNSHLISFYRPNSQVNVPFQSLISGNPFIDMVLMIQRHFIGCLITNAHLDNNMQYQNHPSLYNCQNSLKLISKHRLIDGQYDCYLKDDETYKNSCLLNDQHRLKCPNQAKCLSPVLQIDECELEVEFYQTKIPFKQLCNRIQ